MEVWSDHVSDSGESPYASTFYAHPLACAGTLAAVERLTSEEIRRSVAEIGNILGEHTDPTEKMRVIGAMAAIDEDPRDRSANEVSTLPLVTRLMTRGVLAIPGGLGGVTTSFYPSFRIARSQLVHALGVVRECFGP
jgi:adenosylmethionine-8-amino-7-oxononanoate aminotransferase